MKYGHCHYDSTPTHVQRLIWRYTPRESTAAEIAEALVGIILSAILFTATVVLLALPYGWRSCVNWLIS